MKILITGAAGFIGFHLTKRFLNEKLDVIGFDSLNDYYDVNLKKSRLDYLFELSNKNNKGNFIFYRENLENKEKLNEIFYKHKPSKVINLAAQAGVRFSITNPGAYIDSNLVGFLNLIECCRNYEISNLIYASSSSVYGGNKKLPFSEKDSVDHPVSLYAATKRANELIAHSYSHLFNLSATGLRFFTVYGPWGRPDMALFLFTKSILEGKPIKVFNNGNMVRDFTYIDDIVESIFRLLNLPAVPTKNFDRKNPDPSKSWAPHNIFNIGNSRPTQLLEYIRAIESALNLKADFEYLPMQDGDVEVTEADTSSLESWIDFKPNTSVDYGVNKFVDWYLDFYKHI